MRKTSLAGSLIEAKLSLEAPGFTDCAILSSWLSFAVMPLPLEYTSAKFADIRSSPQFAKITGPLSDVPLLQRRSMKQRNVQLRNSPPNVESQGTKPSRWAPTSTKAPNLSMARTIPVLGWLQNATNCRYCYYYDEYYCDYYDYYHCYYNYHNDNNNSYYYYYYYHHHHHHYSMLAFSSAATLYPLICPCPKSRLSRCPVCSEETGTSCGRWGTSCERLFNTLTRGQWRCPCRNSTVTGDYLCYSESPM